MRPPLPPLFLEALRRYADDLRARFGLRLRFVRLFGSWARGEAREESDIDVAVVIEGLTRDEWRDAVGLVAAVELEQEVSLSPYVVSGEHFDLLLTRDRRLSRDILQQGLVI